MSFEEEFPNLIAYDIKVVPVFTDEQRVVPINFIQHHCLDKNKVREALDKVLMTQHPRQTGKTMTQMLLLDIKVKIIKELKL